MKLRGTFVVFLIRVFLKWDSSPFHSSLWSPNVPSSSVPIGDLFKAKFRSLKKVVPSKENRKSHGLIPEFRLSIKLWCSTAQNYRPCVNDNCHFMRTTLIRRIWPIHSTNSSNRFRHFRLKFSAQSSTSPIQPIKPNDRKILRKPLKANKSSFKMDEHL